MRIKSLNIRQAPALYTYVTMRDPVFLYAYTKPFNQAALVRNIMYWATHELFNWHIGWFIRNRSDVDWRLSRRRILSLRKWLPALDTKAIQRPRDSVEFVRFIAIMSSYNARVAIINDIFWGVINHTDACQHTINQALHLNRAHK